MQVNFGNEFGIYSSFDIAYQNFSKKGKIKKRIVYQKNYFFFHQKWTLLKKQNQLSSETPNTMIRSMLTVHFPPSLLETDHLQTSATTTPSTYHNRHTISRDYRSAALSGRGGGSHRVLRCTAAEAASTSSELASAADTVRNFYDGINRRDLASVVDLIALNCVYEDLIFSQPFTGRKVMNNLDIFVNCITFLIIQLILNELLYFLLANIETSAFAFEVLFVKM